MCAPSVSGEELPLSVRVICLQCRSLESFAYDFNPRNSRAYACGWVRSEPPQRVGRLGWAWAPAGQAAAVARAQDVGRGRGTHRTPLAWQLREGAEGRQEKPGACSPPLQAAGQEGAPGSRLAEGPCPPACGAAAEGQAVPCPLGPPQHAAHLLFLLKPCESFVQFQPLLVAGQKS